jgi:hypothetical protein
LKRSEDRDTTRRVVRVAVGPIWVAAALLVSTETRADVTSWLAVGSGGALEKNHLTGSHDLAPAITYSLGVGSTPVAPFVVGGLVRGRTMLGLGTDLGVAVRAATGGFARGDWGAALDAGALWRSWRGGSYGVWPLQAVLTGGSPWGLQLAVGTELWNVAKGTPAQGFFAAIELDLLRLTLMRQGSTERWWPNPNPAGGHMTSSLAP